MKFKLSIIIAAYNEEQNIANCINCLLKQTYQDFNIIIVDDGSTDLTAKIIKEYIIDNNNIQYFFQENQGASSARKLALLKANSEYISFIDADDLLSVDAIDSAMSIISDTLSDIVLFDLKISINKANTVYQEFRYSIEENIFKGEKAFHESILNWGVHGLGVYKREIFLKSNFEYDELNTQSINYVNNDEIISRLCFINSKKIAKCMGVYYYQYNQNSTTKSVNEKFYLIIENTKLLKLYCDKKNINSQLAKKLIQDIYDVFKRYRKHSHLLRNKLTWKSYLIDSINNSLFSRDFFKLDLKERVILLKMKIYFLLH